MKSTTPMRMRLIPVAVSGLVAVMLVAGIVPRLHARAAQTHQVDEQREPLVSTISPKQAPATQELLLPASVMPWADASIYARTSGYVQQWYADIGTHVKAGQLLASIETPELDAQLRQARADAAMAQADYRFANSTASRWQTMLQTQSVSQQDADAKTSDSDAKRAALQSKQADVTRLQEMASYQKVTAPFDGVITVRNVDIGSLVTAGGAPGLAGMPGELMHIEQTDRLRVFADVPQDDAASVKPGSAVYLTSQQYPGRRFPATLARSAGAIDPVSRTLHVEADIDNRDGALMPGAYAELHLALVSPAPELQLPASALLFRPDGVTVAVLGRDGKAKLKKVTIGRDFGIYVEIATGLDATDRVIDNPSDSIHDGEALRTSTHA
ncbi:RND transporter MFP subunit [Burkholderia sp. SFA1]|uniref:RND family efflux transporter MFP subunit n=1 Tax=Caballeronia cordobensis TaxID=1353886 RepID=A0A158H725_CABCO|nr:MULTISPECIES: efflux RND transporter periplasmic adaptor subunit [Caballeronia]MCE4543999.1 efflux RND transporter periplasmic adaptor subunit [Caballeronia sp. PC1]MCE4571150.1 efflux RND transporter periplasmic adaptor subunit [Caballeronia sp. CLC5]BBP98933.1 RND transporter MFP subunit [Burkholderia sp. SFA1]SAL39783.1 RND family efflux transporter MFP subunit [Caballeronia cordobensis]